jgi:hypothetical protein
VPRRRPPPRARRDRGRPLPGVPIRERSSSGFGERFRKENALAFGDLGVSYTSGERRACAGRSRSPLGGYGLPNPLVGAVLLWRGRILARMASPLRTAARERPAGSDAGSADPPTRSWSARPCVHAGKNAPVRRSAAGRADPPPSSPRPIPIRACAAGHRPAARGRRCVGLLGSPARDLNAAYFALHRERRSRVTLESPRRWTARWRTLAGGSRWITGPGARRESAGRSAPTPSSSAAGRSFATIGSVPEGATALPRIVLVELSIDPGCHLAALAPRVGALAFDPTIFRQLGRTPPSRRRRRRIRWVAASPHRRGRRSSRRRIEAFSAPGWEVWRLRPCGSVRAAPSAGRPPGSTGNGIDLRALTRRTAPKASRPLHRAGARSRRGFSARVVDRLLLFVAPKILGGRQGCPALPSPSPIRFVCGHPEVARFGTDLLLGFAGRAGRRSSGRGARAATIFPEDRPACSRGLVEGWGPFGRCAPVRAFGRSP